MNSCSYTANGRGSGDKRSLRLFLNDGEQRVQLLDALLCDGDCFDNLRVRHRDGLAHLLNINP